MYYNKINPPFQFAVLAEPVEPVVAVAAAVGVVANFSDAERSTPASRR